MIRMTAKLNKFPSHGARPCFFLPEDDNIVESEDEPDEYDETIVSPHLIPASKARPQSAYTYNYSSVHASYYIWNSFPRLYHP
jgi:hypothetical protein